MNETVHFAFLCISLSPAREGPTINVKDEMGMSQVASKQPRGKQVNAVAKLASAHMTSDEVKIPSEQAEVIKSLTRRPVTTALDSPSGSKGRSNLIEQAKAGRDIQG